MKTPLNALPETWALWLFYGSNILIIFSIVFHSLIQTPLFNRRTSTVLAVCFGIISVFGVDALIVRVFSAIYGVIGVYIALSLGFLVLGIWFTLIRKNRKG